MSKKSIPQNDGKNNLKEEVKNFHPLVKQWLIENGYTTEHHKRMPGYGVVDFYAINQHERLVIECKCQQSAVTSSIKQVIGYTDAFNRFTQTVHIPCIAIPSQFTLSQIAANECLKMGIRVFKIDGYTEPSMGQSEDPIITKYWNDMIRTAVFADRLLIDPRSGTQMIVEFHERYGTSPLRDLCDLWIMAKSNIYHRCHDLGGDFETKIMTHKEYFMRVFAEFCHDEFDMAYVINVMKDDAFPTVFNRRIDLKAPEDLA